MLCRVKMYCFTVSTDELSIFLMDFPPFKHHQPSTSLRLGVFFLGSQNLHAANSLRLEEKHCRIKTSIEEGASLEWESKALEIRHSLRSLLVASLLGVVSPIVKNLYLKIPPFGEKKSLQLETSNWLEPRLCMIIFDDDALEVWRIFVGSFFAKDGLYKEMWLPHRQRFDSLLKPYNADVGSTVRPGTFFVVRRYQATQSSRVPGQNPRRSQKRGVPA